MKLLLVSEIGDSSVGNAVLLSQSSDGAVSGQGFQLCVDLSGQLAALLEADCVVLNIAGQLVDDDGIARKDKVDFSYNYMENRQVIVAKADAGIASVADLAGKVAAVESGSAGESYAASFEGVTTKGSLKQTDCLMEVNAGAADFAVLDAQLAKSYAGQGDYANLVIVDGLSSDVEYYAIGFKKGSDLTAKVNAQLEALAADGTIAKLAEQYGVENTAITDFADQK